MWEKVYDICFFKQKTAYEMRISDWSSDVCSSDLIGLDEMIVWDFTKPLGGNTPEQIKAARMILWRGFCSVHQMFQPVHIENFRKRVPNGKETGRASCRERVGQSV